MRKKAPILFLTILGMLLHFGVPFSVMGQTANISGVVNEYTRITQLAMFNGDGHPTAVVVSDTTGFSAGDTVIVFQPKGFPVDEVNGDIDFFGDYGYGGKYSILIIKKIHPDKRVEFFVPFFYFNSNKNYNPGEIGMLIRVPSYENAVVDGTLTAEAWNPDSATGGVVALFVKRKLRLEADIDVTGLGFKGADPGSDIFGGSTCASDDSTSFIRGFFTETAEDSAGLKGEGAEATNFSLLRGRIPAVNGGGGGNARYSGGGGGSNFTRGTKGGNESNLCPISVDSLAGEAGFSFTGTISYTNLQYPIQPLNHFYANRIFFGGGGGTGTQDPGFPASRGGNGGGIVIIIADTIEAGAGVWIRADGDPVTDIVAGAGGGGGGGGCIVIDVSHYEGTVNLSAKGGKGGDTNNDSYETGPGGAGGGGIYWLRDYENSLNLNLDMSTGGEDVGAVSGGSTSDGAAADSLTGLNIPLDGFLFNVLPSDTAVCNNVIPDPIDASTPRGGDGNYTFTWQYHDLDNPGDTTTISGASEDFVFTAPLTADRKFWRIVQSGDLIEGDPATGGTEESIIYYVLDSIKGDDIVLQRENDSLICEGMDPLQIRQNPDSSYTRDPGTTRVDYEWYMRSDLTADWGLSVGTNENFDPGALTDTTWFKRVHIATKETFARGRCVATDSVRINVLPRITGNIISGDTTLCEGQTPLAVGGNKPGGGDQDNFRYLWLRDEDAGGSFAGIPGSDVKDYQSPALFTTTYFKRVFFSGNNESCVDTSDMIEIEVLEPIGNNQISVDPSTDSICQGSTLDPLLAGTAPTGGRTGNYRYRWEIREWDTGTWIAGGSAEPTNPALVPFDDTTLVRRIVNSGPYDVCRDTSNVVSIKVISNIVNNNILTPAFDTCQFINLPLINAAPPGGGDGTYGFLWETSADGSTGWTPAAGSNNNSLEDFDPDDLAATTYFRRLVWSDVTDSICIDTSAFLVVNIQPEIQNNIISHPLEYVCYNEDLLISGTDENSPEPLVGGDGSYNYTWQESNDSDTTSFSGIETTRDYTESGYTDQRYFRRIVGSGTCLDTTSWKQITVKRLPFGELTLAPGEFLAPCENDPVVFNLGFSGETDVTSFSYTIGYDTTGGSDSFNGTQLGSFGTTEHLPVTADSTIYTYYLSVIEDSNGCLAPPDSMLGSVTIKVYQTPEAEIINPPDSICGPFVALNAVPDRGGSGHWEKTGGILPVTFDPGDVEATEITIASLESDEETMTYAWILTTPRCSDTAYTTVTHFRDPDQPPYFPVDTVKIFFSDTLTLVASEPTSGSGTWSVVQDGYGMLDGAADQPAVLATGLEMSESLDEGDLRPNTFTWTVRNGACGPYSDNLTVIRLDVTQYDGFSPNSDDEINRYYVMRGLSAADDFTFTLFNSWGTRIRTITREDAEELGKTSQGTGSFAVEDELILWDGTAADGVTLVPDGTYYYNIDIVIGEETYRKKGFILLKTRN